MFKNAEGQVRAGRVTAAIVVGLLALIVIVGGFFTVDAGERAVVLRFGSVARAEGEGLHLKAPLVESVISYETRTQKEQTEAGAASKDLQDVTTVVAINYSLDVNDVSAIYRTLGTEYKSRIIDPAVQEAVKAATANYTAEELITKREIVKDEIQSKLGTRLAENHILVSAVSIVDFKFSPSFSQAIEAKVTAEQNALAAKNKVEQANYEAQAIRIKSEAANNEKYIQLQTLDVQRAAIEKWNGVLPTQFVPGSAIPFINAATR